MHTPEATDPMEIHSLYANHHGWLYNWLRRRMGCSHRAADLAHDTYLRLMVSGRLPVEQQARPYLMQIAKGLVIDRRRRSRIEQAWLETLTQQPDVFAPSPEESAIALEALIQIDALLAALKPRVRETFLLSRFDGLTYSDIASRLHISVASVRKYMLIAIQHCLCDIGSDTRS